MNIKTEKNMLRISFPYDKKKVKFCNLLGMRFSKQKKDWFFENNYMNRECLSHVFPGLITARGHVDTKELTVPSFLMDHQGEALRAAAKQDRRGIYHDTGCHAKGTEVLMADGHVKNVEDVEVGEFFNG